MSTASPDTRALARRLIAIAAARDESSGAATVGAVQVCDRFRVPLARLVGGSGVSLSLVAGRGTGEGGGRIVEPGAGPARRVVGGIQRGRAQPTPGPGGDGGTAIVAHLLGLLVTFIGEPLTRQLVCDVWPDAATDEIDGRAGGQP